LCETLLALDSPAEARQTATAALAICKKVGIHAFSHEVERLCALAEAKLGDFAAAVARLDALIEAQTALGVTGLRIGVTYEARAEVALWSDDAAAFETFASLTAREYRHGSGCPLSARYERLTNEARRRGVEAHVSLGDFATTLAEHADQVSSTDSRSAVRAALANTQDASARYGFALRMVCQSRAARGGHLYLAARHGPQLVATHELSAPSERLAQCVREYLDEQSDQFDTQTVAVHGVPQLETTTALTRVDGTDYELLLLSRVIEGGVEITGVVALAPGQHSSSNPRQWQLLAAIGEQLASLSPPT
jgi:hypothetical protein